MRLTCLLLLLAHSCVAQFFYDFSDPLGAPFYGDTAHFRIQNAALIVDAPPLSDTMVLSHPMPFTTSDSIVMRIDLALHFNPSTNNRFQWRLLGPDGQGYYLRLGESGSEDKLKLYRQDAGKVSLLATGTTSLGSSPSGELLWLRDRGGQWSVYWNGQAEFQASDSTYRHMDRLDLWCKYTSSNSSGAFEFDNYALSGKKDDTPPRLLHVKLLDKHRVVAHFDEVVAGFDSTSGAQVDSVVANMLYVQLDGVIDQRATYGFTVYGLQDAAGNRMDSTAVHFEVQFPFAGDVRLSEVLIDPLPAIGLPHEEFVELWNVSGDRLDIGNCIWSDESSQAIIPAAVMEAGDYLLLTTSDFASWYSRFGTTLGLNPWPSLNNSGDLLTLRNPIGDTLLHFAYGAAQAQDGVSWTLTDTITNCSDGYQFSSHPDGGTPGSYPNDWVAVAPEDSSVCPHFALQGDTIVLKEGASAWMDIQLQVNDHTLLAVSDWQWLLPQAPPANSRLVIEVLEVKTCYETLYPNCSDTIQLPGVVYADSIWINELLFDPLPGGADYIEVYNASSQFVDMASWVIEEWADSLLADVATIQKPSYLPPHCYRVFTSDHFALDSFEHVDSTAVVELSALPNWSDEGGGVVLRQPDGRIVDSVVLHADQHHVALSDPEGYALERIDADQWSSAAWNIGRGTPTRRNSQFVDIAPDGPAVQVFNDALVVDGAGQDVLRIQYADIAPQSLMAVHLLDRSGRALGQVQDYELISGSGQLLWDGRRRSGQKLPMGLYLLQVDIKYFGGGQRRFHFPVALGYNYE